MTLKPYIPTQDDLENLFVNNEDLDQIAAYLSRFNPIRIMRMQEMEIRHSSILAWLLDPRESHGLGDYFLRVFLGEALRGQEGAGSLTALMISQVDLRNADVQREWQGIDIFIQIPEQQWAFVVENKFRGKQHKGQLTKYIEKVEQAFKSREKRLQVQGIFLTLLDEEPEDERYAVIKYTTVRDLLLKMLEKSRQVLSREVQIFLEQYLEVVEEAAGVSKKLNEMEVLARQLYRGHKKVLDFVVEHGASTEFMMATEHLFGADLNYGSPFRVRGVDYIFNGRNKRQCSFLPSSWVTGLGGEEAKSRWKGCETWWAGYPLICWLQLVEKEDGVKGNLRLYAEVGPLEDAGLRKSLIERIEEKKSQDGRINFRGDAKREGKKFSKFLSKNNLEIRDVHDAEEIEGKIESLLSNFEATFESVSAAIVDFRPNTPPNL